MRDVIRRGGGITVIGREVFEFNRSHELSWKIGLILEMATKVVASLRLFLIKVISYAFRSMISALLLHSIKMYIFLQRSGCEFKFLIKNCSSRFRYKINIPNISKYYNTVASKIFAPGFYFIWNWLTQ